MNGGGWVNVTRAAPCLKCGSPDWCTRTADGLTTKCTRQSGGRAIPQRDGTIAYYYRTADLGPVPAKRDAKPVPPPLGKSELQRLIKSHQAGVSDRRLDQWSRSLGVSVRAMREYGVGMDPDNGWASFPMYDGTVDAKGQPVPCGIRLRDPGDGRKMCVRGSRNGLFLPAGYDVPNVGDVCDSDGPLLLLMPEGPTDSCAAYDLGFRAIGRPSNSGGIDQIRHLLAAGAKQDVAIVADRDATHWHKDGTPHWPGWEGSLAMAGAIASRCERVRIMQVPAEPSMMTPPWAGGRRGAKDLRQWLREGGTAGMIMAVMAAADVCAEPRWFEARRDELLEWKIRLRRAA